MIDRYLKWLKTFPGELTFVGWPVSFDFMFVVWYLIRYAEESPFGHSGLCSRSYLAGMLEGKSWERSSKNAIPERFRSRHPHDHTPLNDAIQQAQEFASMYYENAMTDRRS